MEYTYYDLSIAVQHKTNLNTEERPCVDDEDYSVEDCLESFFQETIGCRLPWSHLNNVCTHFCPPTLTHTALNKCALVEHVTVVQDQRRI